MSTLPKTKRCFVCSDEFTCSNLTERKENLPPSGASEDEENNFNDNLLTLTENTKLCKRFCILAARYLDFNHFNCNRKNLNLNTAETLKLYLDSDGIVNDGDGDTICCDNCVKIVDTFCANYEALTYLQIELDWNLRQITKIMQIGKMNQMRNEIVNQQDNDHDDPNQLTDKFKTTLLSKHFKAKKKKYPRLTLSKVAEKSETGKQRSIATSPVRDTNNLDVDITTVKIDPGTDPEPAEAQHIPSPILKVVPTFKMTRRKRHICLTCGKSFAMVSQLRSHEEIHILEEDQEAPPPPLKCEICGKEFLNADEHRRHVMGHTIKRPYKCRFCESRFLQESNLRSHENWHVRGGNKKATYLCTYCGQAFTKSSNKVRHERIHTNERPYQCPCCEFKFNDRSAWKKHIQRRHGKTTILSNQKYGHRKKSADVQIQNGNLDNATFHSGTGTGVVIVNSASSSKATSAENCYGTAEGGDAAVYYQEFSAVSIKTSVDDYDIDEVHAMEIENLDAEYPPP